MSGAGAARQWHAERAWLGELRRDVLISVDDGRISALESEVEPPPGCARLPGLTIPALANAHSHAFHRALRGRTQGRAADFWSWRELMYQLVERLDPESCFALARAVYAEMALAGIGLVGEFHYVHHDRDGRPYADPNAMGEALRSAADEAGLRLTLIDTCYLRGGLAGEPLEPAQRRFSDGSVAGWAERVGALPQSDTFRVAGAIHSVRAVDPDSIGELAEWAEQQDAPLHVHVSEQPAENEACLAATGRTPTQLLAERGAVSSRTALVHATHLDAADVETIGGAGAWVCLCPTTERDLGDGIGPARALADAGARLTVGSDMHAMVDLFEEVRALELDERLISGRRGLHAPEALLDAATLDGARAIGWDGSGLAAGERADFATVDLASPRTAGGADGDVLGRVVFAATAADVTHLVVAGKPVVEDRRHLRVGDVGAEIERAVARVL